jgi:hypothetical protein
MNGQNGKTGRYAPVNADRRVITTEKEAAEAKKQTRFPHKSVPVQEKRENSELAPGPNALVSPFVGENFQNDV